MTDRNPQAEQMADESMMRTLAAQAEAIWPQEQHLFDRYDTSPRAGAMRIADIGCGTGEITGRLAMRYPGADVIGVDILDSSLDEARTRLAHLSPRVQFERGDAFALAFPDAHFDLVVCRHLTQAVPEPQKVLAELTRICRPGGWLHVLSEDYGMLHMPAAKVDPDRLWYEAVFPYTRSTGTDARIGRRTWSLMHQLGTNDLHVDYIVVDTVRVPRETFAAIMKAWRDGYTDALATHSGLGREQVSALFNQIVESVLDPNQYAVWHVPVVSGRRPEHR